MSKKARIKIEVSESSARVEIEGKPIDIVTELSYLMVKNAMLRNLIKESLEISQSYINKV